MVWRFHWLSRGAGVLAALALGVCLFAARPCFALGSLLAAEGDLATAVEIRFAIAPSETRTTRWVAVRVHAASRRVAWVVPLLPGVAIDPANDAWLDALEQATAPRVVAPAGSVPAICGPTAFEDTTGAPLHGVPPSRVAVLSSFAALERFAGEQGFALPVAERQQLSSTAGAEYLALVYTAPAAEFWTETLRVQSGAGAVGGALTGLFGDEAAVVTLFSVGAARARFPAVSELSAPQIGATWLLQSASSDYRLRREAHLNQGTFVLESSEAGSVYDARALGLSTDAGPGSVPDVPPLVRAYFDRARHARLTPESTVACEQRLFSARQQGNAGARVGQACAPGILAQRPANEPCVEAVHAGEIAAETLRCGNADDLALALAGLDPSAARVTRHVARLDARDKTDLVPSVASGPDVPSLWFAQRSDEATCGSLPGAGAGPGSYEGAPVGGGVTQWGSGGAGGEIGEGDAPAREPDGGCASSAGFACSSDEPGYTSDEDESCSADSAESSDDESCSGDDESSGYDGETCSDDPSEPEDSGYDGETCSDDSSSSEDDSCAVRRPARFRPRFSVLTLALVSVLLPLRRWSRRKRRNSPGGRSI